MNFVIPGIKGRSNIFGVAGIENAINSQERNYIFSNSSNPTPVSSGASSIITLSRNYAWVWSAIQPPLINGSAGSNGDILQLNFFDQENRPIFSEPLLANTIFGDDLSVDYPLLPLRPCPPASRIKIVWNNLSNSVTLGFEIILRGFEVLDIAVDLDNQKSKQSRYETNA